MLKPKSPSTSHGMDAWNQRVMGHTLLGLVLVSVTLISHLFGQPQASRRHTEVTWGLVAARCGSWQPLASGLALAVPQQPRGGRAGQGLRPARGCRSASSLRCRGGPGHFRVSSLLVRDGECATWDRFIIGCEISLGQGRGWNDNFTSSLTLNEA